MISEIVLGEKKANNLCTLLKTAEKIILNDQLCSRCEKRKVTEFY